MPDNGNGNSREEDLSRLLTDAVEVQLAALKAGISFWTEWVETTTEFVQSATRTLSEINDEDKPSKDVVLELVDASRASMRSMTQLPRSTATRFIEELDRFEEKRAAEEAETKKESAPRAAKKTAKKKRAARPKRAAKAKA